MTRILRSSTQPAVPARPLPSRSDWAHVAALDSIPSQPTSKELISDSLRAAVLNEANRLTSTDRANTYGDPKINLACVGELMNVYYKYARSKCPGHEAAIMQVIAKLARIACGPQLHRDNYVDGAAYFAIAFECEQYEQSDNTP